jgi:hypothetical protein
MAAVEKRDLERLRYRSGQRLTSQDFNDQAEIEAQYRWWHNRALHSAFGVAAGLLPNLAGQQVTVSAGVAYDGYGRELVAYLNTSIALPQPASSSLLLLFARYRETRAQADGLPGTCSPMLARTGGPATFDLAWIEEPAWRRLYSRDGVVLGSLTAGGKQFTSWQMIEDLYRVARPLARPRIAHGQTIPGATPWEAWELFPGARSGSQRRKERLSRRGRELMIQLRVDTAAAGFLLKPHFFVTLQAERWEPTVLRGLNIFEHIAEVSSLGFTYRVVILDQAGIAGKDKQLNFDFVQDVRPYITWIGLEPLARGTD